MVRVTQRRCPRVAPGGGRLPVRLSLAAEDGAGSRELGTVVPGVS